MTKQYSDLEIAEHYEQQAAKCFAHAVTLDKTCPEGAHATRDYAQHCATMAEIFRLRHSDAVAESTKCDDAFFAPCWRGYGYRPNGLSDIYGPEVKSDEAGKRRS